MSIFGKVAGFFGGVIDSVRHLAEKVWGAIGTVWAFLVSVAQLVSDAWNWMVNGVEWFTNQISDWAASVYTTLWHTLTNVIPKAAEWAFRQATSWAGAALHTAQRFLQGLIHTVRVWAERELASLAHTAKGWVSSVIHWVTGPINWVLNTGRHLANLVLHPEALVKWILGSLIEPLIMYLLRSGANILLWFLRLVVRDSSEVAHMLESIIERIV